MSFNFKGVEAAKPSSYLKPGYYRVRVTDAKAGKFDKSGIPYVEITFTTQDKLSITEKFVLKSKEPNPKFNPISRLVYLHEAWLGKAIDQDFKSPDDVATYFKKALVNKSAGVKTIVVGGEVVGKVVYGRIPLAGFIVPEGTDVALGEFEEGSDEWKQFVRKSNRTTEATGKKGGLLNDDDDEDDDFGGEEDEDDETEEETPPAKPAAKKAAAKPAAKPAAKKPVKKEEPKEEEAEEATEEAGGEDDDFEW
jgi:hypothetical protein